MVMSEVEHVLLSELLEWYHLQRHDFLNHWQVITGKLQLRQLEKALTYMGETLLIQKQEQKIVMLREPVLMAILLGLLVGFRQAGVKVSFAFPEQMKNEDYWRDHWREEYAEEFYGYTKECLNTLKESKLLDGTAEVYLFEEPGGLSCQVILDAGDTVLWDKWIKLTRRNS